MAKMATSLFSTEPVTRRVCGSQKVFWGRVWGGGLYRAAQRVGGVEILWYLRVVPFGVA